MNRKRLTGILCALLIGGGTLVIAARSNSGRGAVRGAITPSGTTQQQKSANHFDEQSSPLIVGFGTTYAVDGPFVGDLNAIRGVAGDELPWQIDRTVRSKLDIDGHLTIRVRGLVFLAEDPVPLELQGINDETEFRGLVSCLTEVGPDVVIANVLTEGFPATPSGDSDIKATLVLPNPCVAPIVMVLAGSEDKWFAVTGFEAEEDGIGTGSGSGDEDEDGD